MSAAQPATNNASGSGSVPATNGKRKSISPTTASASLPAVNGNGHGHGHGHGHTGQQIQYDPNGNAVPNPDAAGHHNTQDEDLSALFTARREEDLMRRNRSLAEFLVMLDGYKPLIPEEVTEYYLQKAGFECTDPRLKRLMSLSAQKFIADLSKDAFHFARLRVNGTGPGRKPAAGSDKNKVVLTMDDLSLALGEHGFNIKKPDYYL